VKGTEFLDLDKLNSREDFEKLLFDILEPLRPRFNDHCTGIERDRVFAHYDAKAADMEAFSRPLWGLVPVWGGSNTEDPYNVISSEYAKSTEKACLREQIRHQADTGETASLLISAL